MHFRREYFYLLWKISKSQICIKSICIGQKVALFTSDLRQRYCYIVISKENLINNINMYNNSVCRIKNIIYYKEMLLHSVTRSFCNMRWIWTIRMLQTR